VANKALARVKIGELLKDADRSLIEGRSVRFEYVFGDGGKAEYVLLDRWDRSLAVLDTKSTSVNPGVGGTPKMRCANA
jgi:hypothetical protein